MAIAYDTGTAGWSNSHSFGTALTWSHTVTGSDPTLFVGAMANPAGGLNSATYNGTSMTSVDANSGPVVIFDDMEMWVLGGADTGTNTVSIATNGSGNSILYAKASSYTGTNTTTPTPHNQTDYASSATSNTTTINTSSAPSTDNCWIVGIGITNGNYAQSAGAGTTRRTADASVDNWLSFFDTNAAITPPGSDSIVVNIATSSQMLTIGASLAPTATGYGNTVTGVTSANIGEVNGVATANIAAVNGV